MDNELGSLSKPFTVVLFPCDNSVEAVPTKWISSDKKTCFWPNKSLKSTVLQKLTGDPNSCPGEDWTNFSVTIIKEYGKYTYSYIQLSFE
jgi:hypothetical protein